MNKLFRDIIVVLFIIFFFIGCDDTLTVQNVDDREIPLTNVSFSQDIYPIFQVKCAFSGCHASPNPADGIDLSTWANVTANPYIVFPHNSGNSILVWAIEGRAGISPMPPVGYARPITTKQLAGIKTWIDEGALDN
ncbi:MAG: hypothetical protein IT276_00455 [Ignavibacteriaceae bacterium]|nr:hypothetical protein [Ignavibacteriaceae bacterium]HRN27303.1 hypothetical protein [Ignavibacteriaceae bacterium]HRQ53745.1 hypothetical protein [Ignavibacteriaceae bacterium]